MVYWLAAPCFKTRLWCKGPLSLYHTPRYFITLIERLFYSVFFFATSLKWKRQCRSQNPPLRKECEMYPAVSSHCKSQPCAFRSGYTVLWHTSPEEQRRAHVHHHTDDLKSRNTSKKISVLQQALPVAHSLHFIHNLWSVLGSKHPQLGVQTLTAKQDQPDS